MSALASQVGPPVQRLALLLSARCNLACTYCYQQARRGPECMSWEVARASLDVLLRDGINHPRIEFNGGEPLLEPDLLERCIRYAEARMGSGRPRFVVVTNGTLLDPRLVALLAAHDVEIRISWDGEEEQRWRGRETSERLLQTLKAIRRDRPRYFAERVSANAALMPSTVESLVTSYRLFRKVGLLDVGIYPVLGRTDGMSSEISGALGAQMEEVAEDSAKHWRKTGTIPLNFLRGKEGGVTQSPNGLCCAAGESSGFCVDTGGRSWSCPWFAKSLRRPSALARQASDVLDLGDIRDPSFQRRLAALPARAVRVPLLTHRKDKHSSSGACRDCEVLGECYHCPASTAYLPGNSDPHRVDDFACAFARATTAARRSFHEKTGGAVLAARDADIRAALRRLTDAVCPDPNSPPHSRAKRR
ncbi:MAG: radical SAM protein [Acidobacteriota bacterium]